MRVEFRCKRCGRDIQANFTRAGKMAQCPGCHFTQEIPDPAAGAPEPKGGGGGGGGGHGAPPQRQAPPQQQPQPAKGGGKASGGGADAIIGKVIIFVILAIVAFIAYKYAQGRYF